MSRSPVLLASLAVGVLALAAPAGAQSLQEALANAYRTNPTLQAQRASLRATDERLPQARAGWRPSVTLSGNAGYRRFESDAFARDKLDQQPRDATLQLSQPLYRGGQTTAATERAKQEIQAARARLFVTEQQVLLDGVQAYLDVLRDTATLELQINNERVLTRQLQATRDRFRVGEVTRTDVAQAESRLALANANRQQAEGALNTTKTRFQQIIGDPPGRLAAPRPPAGLPRARDQLQALAAEQNPLVTAAQFDERAAEFRIREVIGQLLPSVSLVASVSINDDVQQGQRETLRTYAVLIQASIPLYEQGSVYSRVREQKQLRSQALAVIEAQKRAAVQAASQSFESLQTAQARVRSFGAQIRSAEIALEGVRQEAAVGTRTTLDVLDAEQELLNGKVNLVSAQRDELFQQFQLAQAVGQLTAQRLALPVELYDFEANFRDVEGRWIGFGILGEE